MCSFVKGLLNKTAEGPTSWSVTTLNGEHGLENKFKESRRNEMEDSNEESSLKIDLNVVNSTFNYTLTQEVR